MSSSSKPEPWYLHEIVARVLFRFMRIPDACEEKPRHLALGGAAGAGAREEQGPLVPGQAPLPELLQAPLVNEGRDHDLWKH